MEAYLLFHYPTNHVRFDVVRRSEVKESERKNESESEKNPPLQTFGGSIAKEVVYNLNLDVFESRYCEGKRQQMPVMVMASLKGQQTIRNKQSERKNNKQSEETMLQLYNNALFHQRSPQEVCASRCQLFRILLLHLA